MDPAALLADSAWLSRLALALADSPADAADIAQETQIAAWEKRPDPGRSLRPWLTKVARDLAAMRRRADRRRAARHAAAHAQPSREPAQPDELLARAELHRAVVAAVLALPEPLRGTLLARFVDGQSSAAIARAQGVPEATVRGRVRDGLARVRAALDAEQGGRARWAPIALACGPRGSAEAAFVRVAVAAVAVATVVVGLLVSGGLGAMPGTTSPAGGDTAWNGATGAQGSATDPSTADVGEQDRDHRSARRDDRTARRALTPEPTFAAPRPWWDLPDVQLVPIAGRVVDDTGAPVAGARVEAFGWSRVSALGAPEVAISDARGQFRFDGAARDATMHQLFASAPGYAAGTALADPRAPANETDPAHVTIVVTACDARISGIISEHDGPPIAGAVVAVTGGSQWAGGGTRTDARGHYELCVPRDAKWLLIGADGHEHLRIGVPPGDGARVDRALGMGGEIRGRVVDAETGEPVPVAQVMAGGDYAAARNTVTDADGAFVLDGLAPEEVSLNVWAADHLFPEKTTVRVVAGATVEGVELAVPPAVVVRGVVRSHGQALAGASIRFATPSPRGPMDSLRAVAGPDGRFVAINVGLAMAVRVRVDGARAVRVTGGRGDGDVIDTRALDGDLDIEVE